MAIFSIINADAGTQLKGSVIRVIAGSDEGKLAIATSPTNTSKICGVRIADVAPGAMGQAASFEPGVRIRMEAEPTLYLRVYLSGANAGFGVQSAASVEVLLGVCYAKENVGGVWFAECTPIQLAATSIVPTPLSDNTPESIGATVTSGVGTSASRVDHSHPGSYDIVWAHASSGIVVPRSVATPIRLIQFPIIWDLLPAGNLNMEMAWTMDTATETAFTAYMTVYVGATLPTATGGTTALSATAAFTDNGTFLYSTAVPSTFLKPVGGAASATMVDVWGRCYDPGVGESCNLLSLHIRIMGVNVP